MQYVSVYDKHENLYEQIKNMNFWNIRNDYTLGNAVSNEAELYAELGGRRSDILLYVISEEFTEQILSKAANMFLGVKIILIGHDRSYETVRQYFLSGAFDYLVQPLDLNVLEQSLIRVDALYGAGYIANELRMQASALIDNIFLGGEQEKIIIDGIIDKIYGDWKKDLVSCQMIADKAKQQVYEMMIDRKPWLEKFLNANDFTYKPGFALLSKSEVADDWLKAFSEASRMVRKYQMIDEKPVVYRIGKYVVVHVDEKLTLESVAQGVYLNPSYVSHIFKKITGMSFMDYMAEVKIDRAKVLFKNPQLKVYDVASVVGYSNAEYFSKIFKKKTGYSPTAYQKTITSQ